MHEDRHSHTWVITATILAAFGLAILILAAWAAIFAAREIWKLA
jgi:hypothetical protein